MKKKMIFLGILIMVISGVVYSVSSTYAKYISGIDIMDEARVAKWDITISDSRDPITNKIDLFKDSYLDDNGEAYVDSFNGDNVVAPGTKGEYKFTIQGAPETNYKLNVKVTEKIDTIGRLVYRLDGKCTTTDINRLAWCIENTYSSNKVFAANTPADYDVVNKKQISHTISWEWEFGDPDSRFPISEQDAKDTEKGNAAINDKDAPGYENQPKVKMGLQIVAVQTKEAATN